MAAANSPTAHGHDRYPGTRSFTDHVADQRVFFGRGREILESLHQMLTTSLLVVFGKSGIGKTSLLQAGVFPRLREQDLVPLTVRVHDTTRPLLDLIVETIAEQCPRQAIDYTPGDPTDLWTFFKTAVFLRGDRLQTPVLVFDQFEELFTLQEPVRRTRLIQALADLTSGRVPDAFRIRRQAGERVPYSDHPPAVKVVLSLREDYLGALQEITYAIPTILAQRFRLTEFGATQARDAMQGPAAIHDAQEVFSTQAFGYTDEAMEQIVTFLQGRTGSIEPFQLQILCQHVERQVRLEQAHGRTDIQVDGRYLGDAHALQAILENFYRTAIHTITPRRQRTRVRQLCEEGLLNRRGQRLLLEERQILDTYKVSLEALSTLVDIRLLRKEPRLEGFFYEISHDTLAQPILRSRRFRIPPPVWYGGLAIMSLIALAGVLLVREATLAEERATSAQAAAAKARQARTDAESLLNFLLFDLRNKLSPIGRLDIMKDVLQQIDTYYARMSVEDQDTAMLRQRAVAYRTQGDILRAQGNLTGAFQAYQKAHTIVQKLVAQDATNTLWQRDLALSYEKVGNVLEPQGQRTEALQAYRDSLAIRQKLVAQDATNTLWQRDLSVSYNKVGNVLEAQDQRTEALQTYHDSLAIVQKLAAQDPTNTQWQRDLSVSYNNVGNVLKAQDQRTEALQAYHDSLAIVQKLAAQDPTNTEWQRDLSVSYNKVGNMLKAQGQLPDALQAYRNDLAIAQKLAAQDPTNTEWQRDLSVSYEKVGDVLEAQGQLPDALQTYRDSLAIRQKLAAQDPTNTQWQRDLSVSYNKVGNVLKAQDQRTEALQAYHDSLAIVQKLAAQDPTNTEWQRDLSVSYNKVGNMLEAQGQLPEALQTYHDSLAIVQKLAAQDPTNTQWQRDLSVSYNNAGDVLKAQGQRTEALQAYRDSLAIRQKLAAQDATNTGWQIDLARAFWNIGTHLDVTSKPARQEAKEKLGQALHILRTLQEQSRLAPRDQRWMESIATRLREL